MDGTTGPVVLINLFQVPTGADEGFIAAWEHARDFLQVQDGYRSTELHLSLDPPKRLCAPAALAGRKPLAVAGRRIQKVHDLGSRIGPLTGGSAGA
jgi:hypothetical protein